MENKQMNLIEKLDLIEELVKELLEKEREKD